MSEGRLSSDAAGPILGIDLGTTNSLVAIADERGPRVLPDEHGRASVPSVVRFERTAGGVHAVVGHEAREGATRSPRGIISSVKRLMGRSFDDISAEGELPTYEVVPGERGTVSVVVPVEDATTGVIGHDAAEQHALSPEEVSAAILNRLKEIAERSLGRPVRRAVITVPAYFDDAQRQATRIAGRLAGLEVVRIVPEPTAAALAYGLGLGREATRNAPRESFVAVYDLGGGTFDMSVLRITRGEQEGEAAFFEVLATSGDTRLGGDDLDHALAEDVLREIGAVSADASLRRAAIDACERAKIELSECERATVRLAMPEGERSVEVSRSRLESLVQSLIARTIACCQRALADARGRGLPAGEPGAVLSAVIMVGGMTRMPAVRRAVRDALGLEPYVAVDPDQVVALGAAVQASVLAGVSRAALLLDVIPLSLGIETVGGAVAKIIVRNTSVPAVATEMFSTSVDNQTSIRLTVYQGEREMAADCRKLAEFHLRGIPPMPAGLPQVEVRFGVDANGVLVVGATERRSGRRASLQVVPNHGLTGEEVERIERESITHAREDMARHRVTDLIVNSELDLRWISQKVTAHGHELEAAMRDDLLAKEGRLRELVALAKHDWKSVDANEVASAKEALDRASVRLQEIAIARSLRDA